MGAMLLTGIWIISGSIVLNLLSACGHLRLYLVPGRKEQGYPEHSSYNYNGNHDRLFIKCDHCYQGFCKYSH